MGEIVTITLKKPLRAPGGADVKQVILREPSFNEYLTHGDPYTVAASHNGTPFMVENADVIAQYLKICLIEPKDPALLEQATARVAREIKERLLGFFQPDAQGDEVSETLPTNSPSEASGKTASQNSSD